jgi:tetratricopeptide (TPR) repeat protein
MKDKFLLFLVFGALVFSSCIGKRELSKKNKNELTEAMYYSYFTDATRQVLVYGNFSDALLLYKKCIDLFPEKAAPYYQISNIYLTTNNYKQGKSYAVKAVKCDDSNIWYLLHLANIYQYENNLDSLIYLYEKIIKVDSNPEYKYSLSIFYSKKGDIQNSMHIIKDLEKELDGTKELLILKHQNYVALNMRDSALAQLNQLVSLFPDDFENYGLLAEYLSEIKKYSRADSVYRKMLEIDPENGLANISFGDNFYKRGEKDSALIHYVRGFESDDLKIEDKISLLFNFLNNPNLIRTDSTLIKNLIDVLKEKYNDPRCYTVSAEFYVKSLKYQDAANELEHAIELGSNEYIVWEQYIMINNYLANHEKVLDIYQLAVDKFKDKPKIFVYSGYSLYALKKYDLVIQLCDTGLKYINFATDDKVQIYNLLADSYRQKLDYAKSDSLYEEIIKFDPNNLFIRNNYSYYLALRNYNLSRAKELSEFTVLKEPRNSTYLDTYGWVLFKMDKLDDAIKYIEAAIKNGAYTNSEVLEHYGDIKCNLKLCSEAIEAWQEALKYNPENSAELQMKIGNAAENCKK